MPRADAEAESAARTAADTQTERTVADAVVELPGSCPGQVPKEISAPSLASDTWASDLEANGQPAGHVSIVLPTRKNTPKHEMNRRWRWKALPQRSSRSRRNS